MNKWTAHPLETVTTKILLTMKIAQVPDNAEEKDGRAVDEEDTVHGMMRTTRARRTIMRRGREYDDRESDAVITIRPVRAI